MLDAEPYFKRSLAIRETRLENNHPDLVDSLEDLAWVIAVWRRTITAEAGCA
jgi:hypothetical protein